MRELLLLGKGELRLERAEIVPIGAISVIPQACVTWRPWRFSNASIIACGAAEPPTIIDRSFERSQRSGSASRSWRIPIQIVGTPAVTVTSLLDEAVEGVADPCAGRGNACCEPTSVHGAGSPTFAWNIGTTGATVSVSEGPERPGLARRSEWITIARCESETTPFGWPIAARVTHGAAERSSMSR